MIGYVLFQGILLLSKLLLLCFMDRSKKKQQRHIESINLTCLFECIRDLLLTFLMFCHYLKTKEY